MKVISTETAPAAIGPYSQAIVSDGRLCKALHKQPNEKF